MPFDLRVGYAVEDAGTEAEVPAAGLGATRECDHVPVGGCGGEHIDSLRVLAPQQFEVVQRAGAGRVAAPLPVSDGEFVDLEQRGEVGLGKAEQVPDCCKLSWGGHAMRRHRQ